MFIYAFVIRMKMLWPNKIFKKDLHEITNTKDRYGDNHISLAWFLVGSRFLNILAAIIKLLAYLFVGMIDYHS